MATVVWDATEYCSYDSHGTTPHIWDAELTYNRGTGGKFLIAKGNIIEGIEAKE